MTDVDILDRVRAMLAAPATVIVLALLVDSGLRAWRHLARLRAVQREAAIVRARATPLRIVR